MTQLYLTGFEIDEFRSFGRFKVALPAGPGVLIVHGSNGLGKSSLFDGLEWALTGEVNHLPQGKLVAKGDYLRRWDAQPQRPTRIRLDFNEGWLARTLDHGLDPEGEQDIETFLKSQKWTRPIGHLERYLLLTHFLGQSTASRMTHRNDKARWTYLQEPAQSDRALELVKALHGHGGSTAARTFDKRAGTLLQEAETIARLIELEEDQWRESRLEGAIDDAAAPAEATSIAEDIAAIARILGPAEAPRLALADAHETLATFLTTTADRLRRRDSAIERARQLLTDAQTGEVARAELRGALTEARAQAEVAASKAEEAIARHADAELARAGAQEALASARAANVALDHFIDMRQKAVNATKALDQMRGLAATVREQIPAAEARVARAQKRRKLTDWLAERERAADEQIRSLAQHRDDLDATLRALARREEAQRNYDVHITREPNLAANIETAQRALEELTAKEVNARTSRDAVKSSSDALAAAVAAVAAHTADDACECPVCGSGFVSNELQRRMAAATERLAPALVSLEAMLGEAMRAREAAERHVRNLADAKTALDLAAAELRARSEAFIVAAAAVAAADANEEEFARLVSQNERNRHLAEFRRRRGRYWINHRIVGGAQGALAEWTAAASQRNEIVRNVDAQDRNVTSLEAALSVAETGLREAAVNADLSTDADDAEIDAARTQRADAERDALAVSERTISDFAAADAALSDARSTHAAASARVVELERQDNARADEAAQRQTEWEGLSIGVAPFDANDLGRAAAALTAIGPDYERARERVEAFQKGRLAAARRERHGQALSDLGKAAGTAPAADRASVREQAATKQRSLLDRAGHIQRARDIAYEATQEVGQRVEAFNKEFLKPLSDLMNDLNRSILTDRNIGLDFRAGKNVVGQRTRTGANTPEKIAKLDPLYIHSEGQMAALAVSMLTAANLSFPWSRWRALVMDDPLQHNDAIHAAAFADMIRNLVIERQYQIFLTTHELAEAQFLRRKFDAAGISCTMIHLTGRGENGVENRIEMPPAPIAVAS